MNPPPAMATPQPQTENASKPLRSTLVSRNVTIAGHRTSVRLEPDMWSGLNEICRRERRSLHEVCTAVASKKSQNTSLTAAIRVYVMSYFRSAATDEGHIKAGHGYYSNGISGGMTTAAHHAAPVGSPRPMSASPFMMGSSSGRVNTSGGGMR